MKIEGTMRDFYGPPLPETCHPIEGTKPHDGWVAMPPRRWDKDGLRITYGEGRSVLVSWEEIRGMQERFNAAEKA